MPSLQVAYVMRVIPRGMPAVGWDDEDECDLDQPCDLVMLTAQILGDGDTEESEVERMAFDTGHAASRYLCECLKQVDPAVYENGAD